MAAALLLKKGSEERKKVLDKLRLKGNYHHNMNVLETGEGDLIVVRRPNAASAQTCKAVDFLACQHCLGFIRKKELWKHVCPFKPDDMPTNKHQSVQAMSKVMMISALSGDTNSLLNQVMATMRTDEPALVARNDWLIKKVGMLLVEKHGTKNNQDTSQKMRELSRLLIQLRKTDTNQNAELSDYIRPEKFDVVVEAVKVLCKFEINDGQQNVKTPSLSLKLGHSLKKCTNIMKGKALKEKDKDREVDADNFAKLLDMEWSHRISHHSLTTLSSRKFNKVDMLPLTEDLTKLRQFIKRKISESTEEIRKHPLLDDWKLLAQLTLTKLVMFNKRRGGEASKLEVKSYQGRPS